MVFIPPLFSNELEEDEISAEAASLVEKQCSQLPARAFFLLLRRNRRSYQHESAFIPENREPFLTGLPLLPRFSSLESSDTRFFTNGSVRVLSQSKFPPFIPTTCDLRPHLMFPQIDTWLAGHLKSLGFRACLGRQTEGTLFCYFLDFLGTPPSFFGFPLYQARWITPSLCP